MRYLPSNDDLTDILDHPLSLTCPHCGTRAGMTAISIPRFGLIHRFKLTSFGIFYRCDACSKPVGIVYDNVPPSNPQPIPDGGRMLQGALEPFEHKYLPADVRGDFTEALRCYSISCWNAFGAMCRRALQSVATSLGADGTTKVQAQLRDLKDMGAVDDDAFTQLTEIMLGGHDGAHPHLPALTPERASILLQLMKDVLYQLFVRPGKIKEAGELRAAQIAKKA